MALSILDGNQSATTLSTIVTSGQHIPAHTVVSLGTQAISNITSAVSGTSVTFGLVGGTVTANNFTLTNVLQYDGSHYFLKVGGVATTGGTSFPVYVAGSVTANPTGTQTISGTVTANVIGKNPVNDSLIQIPVESYLDASSVYVVPALLYNQNGAIYSGNPLAVGGTVTIGSALPAGTNRIGVVTIGGGTVTIGAGTAQIGSVTASISNSLTISSLPDISGTVIVTDVNAVLDGDGNIFGLDRDFPVSGSVTLGAGTAQIGSVTASISNSVVTFYPLQGTAVTNSNFTSTTASTTLVSAVSGREVLTVFNEGAGNLHISPGATCTTVAYQVRLSAGDYWECPAGQLSLAHTAVFSTAGTARVTEVS